MIVEKTRKMRLLFSPLLSGDGILVLWWPGILVAMIIGSIHGTEEDVAMATLILAQSVLVERFIDRNSASLIWQVLPQDQ